MDVNPATWPAATSAIERLFAANGALDVVKQMQIEIRNPAEVYHDWSGVLPNDPMLLEALSQVQGLIRDIVYTSLKGVWSSIAYHKRVNGDDKNTHGKPTVIVSCRLDSTGNFESAEEQIMRVLDTVPVEIHLERLPGEITLC
jgi:hypothetical protein